MYHNLTSDVVPNESVSRNSSRNRTAATNGNPDWTLVVILANGTAVTVGPRNGVHAVNSNTTPTWSSKNRPVDASSGLDTRPPRPTGSLACSRRNYVVDTKNTAGLRHISKDRTATKKTVLNNPNTRSSNDASQ